MTTTEPSRKPPNATAPASGECWVCTQPSARLEHHVLDTDHHPVRDCTHAAGEGVMLCPMCHSAVHNWMRSHDVPGTPAARAGLAAVFTRFTSAVIAWPTTSDT